MLNAYMDKHKISDNELRFHRQNEETFKGLTKEEIYKQFEEEMNMQGLFILGKGRANIMRNTDKLEQFRSKLNKPVEIEWKENEKNFSMKGYINGRFIFDLQKTKRGAVLYPTLELKMEDDMEFNSLQEALDYCNSMKGYFTNIGMNGN
jgi:hypothetical protein